MNDKAQHNDKAHSDPLSDAIHKLSEKLDAYRIDVQLNKAAKGAQNTKPADAAATKHLPELTISH